MLLDIRYFIETVEKKFRKYNFLVDLPPFRTDISLNSVDSDGTKYSSRRCIVVAPGLFRHLEFVSYGTLYKSCKMRAKSCNLSSLIERFLDFLIYIDFFYIY